MEKWVGSVAFVTGASAGIGEAIAERLVQQGINVVGMARRKEKLDAISKRLSSKKIFCGSGKKSKKGKFYGFPGDITQEIDIIKAFKWTYERVGPISILVNNAGVLAAGPLSSTPTKDWTNALDINVLALSIATREAITQMKESNISGHIFHMNAISGHRVLNVDNIGFYAANKYATTALAESLRLELARSGSHIKITSISPGAVKTKRMFKNFANPSPEAQEQLKNMPTLEPADVANAIVLALSTREHVQIPELTIQAVGELF